MTNTKALRRTADHLVDQALNEALQGLFRLSRWTNPRARGRTLIRAYQAALRRAVERRA